MKVGNIVKWAGKRSEYKIGVVAAYCDFGKLWWVVFPDGEYEIQEDCLEIILHHNPVECHKNNVCRECREQIMF